MLGIVQTSIYGVMKLIRRFFRGLDNKAAFCSIKMWDSCGVLDLSDVTPTRYYDDEN